MPVDDEAGSGSPVRLDRWLWAARFYKTRSLAKAAIEGGHIRVDGQRCKPAKTVCVGQAITISRGHTEQEVHILGLSEQRGPAPIAQQLYAETEASVTLRTERQAQRKMERAGLSMPSQKPTKKQRRDLARLKSLDKEDAT